MNDNFEAWAFEGIRGRPNRAGRKRNQIEFGAHIETSVEFYRLPANEAGRSRLTFKLTKLAPFYPGADRMTTESIQRAEFSPL